MNITSETHYLLVNDEGNVVMGENNQSVLVQNAADGDLFSLAVDDAREIFGHDLLPLPHSHSQVSETNSCSQDNERRAWTKEETLALITEYKNHEPVFASSTMRNSKVWVRISNIIKNHNALQCENKFKYLKNQYLKKIENMGPNNTGGAPTRCPFFDELDVLFKKKPFVQPVAIASSSSSSTDRTTQIQHATSNENNGDTMAEEDSIPKKKMKKTSLQIQLEQFDKQSKSKEEARQRRHEENMQKRDRALDIFNNFCQNIVGLLKERKTDE